MMLVEPPNDSSWWTTSHASAGVSSAVDNLLCRPPCHLSSSFAVAASRLAALRSAPSNSCQSRCKHFFQRIVLERLHWASVAASNRFRWRPVPLRWVETMA